MSTPKRRRREYKCHICGQQGWVDYIVRAIGNSTKECVWTAIALDPAHDACRDAGARANLARENPSPVDA